MFLLLFLYIFSEGRKEGVHHLLKESETGFFFRLRSFNALIFFSVCELRGDVELL